MIKLAQNPSGMMAQNQEDAGDAKAEQNEDVGGDPRGRHA
jgi:hypothetical protein